MWVYSKFCFSVLTLGVVYRLVVVRWTPVPGGLSSPPPFQSFNPSTLQSFLPSFPTFQGDERVGGRFFAEARDRGGRGHHGGQGAHRGRLLWHPQGLFFAFLWRCGQQKVYSSSSTGGVPPKDCLVFMALLTKKRCTAVCTIVRFVHVESIATQGAFLDGQWNGCVPTCREFFF